MTEDETDLFVQAALALYRLRAAGMIPKHALAAAEMVDTGITGLLDAMSEHAPHDFLWIATDEEGQHTAH